MAAETQKLFIVSEKTICGYASWREIVVLPEFISIQSPFAECRDGVAMYRGKATYSMTHLRKVA
jgi:hypothetical protein